MDTPRLPCLPSYPSFTNPLNTARLVECIVSIFRCFYNHWNALEAWIIGKELERCYPDVPFADMFVAIDSAAVLRLRVIEMERKQPIQSDNLVKL